MLWERWLLVRIGRLITRGRLSINMYTLAVAHSFAFHSIDKELSSKLWNHIAIETTLLLLKSWQTNHNYHFGATTTISRRMRLGVIWCVWCNQLIRRQQSKDRKRINRDFAENSIRCSVVITRSIFSQILTKDIRRSALVLVFLCILKYWTAL